AARRQCRDREPPSAPLVAGASRLRLYLGRPPQVRQRQGRYLTAPELPPIPQDVPWRLRRDDRYPQLRRLFARKGAGADRDRSGLGGLWRQAPRVRSRNSSASASLTKILASARCA